MAGDGLTLDNRQWFGPLRRRPHVLVFNNTNILNDTTVLTLRYGWTTWQDSCDKQAFSPGIQSLGFNQTYVNALSSGGKDTFPALYFDEVDSAGGNGGSPVRWKGPYAINGALTKLLGSHSLKVGADIRRLGVALATESALSGTFHFNPLFTGRNGVGGNEVASLLLGLPASGEAPATAGDGEWFTRYYGGYWLGGGSPIRGDSPTAEEGTFGWDYFGMTFAKRIDLNWSHGRRYQGGMGAYKTDGPRIQRH